jgi:hypothetical protein
MDNKLFDVKVICSKTRKYDVEKRLKNYVKKRPEEPFIKGQKYYVIDESVPNCVNSIVCNETFSKGDKHSSLGKDENGVDKRFTEHKCFSYDAQFNNGTEKKQIDTLVNEYDENDEFNTYKTKIAKRKYKYRLDMSNPQLSIYYRKCPMFGCTSGTSLMDISGGRRKTRRTKQNRKLRTRK